MVPDQPDSSGLYYKHITIVNYASSIVNKLEALLTDDNRVVIYDRHVFIVQATGYGPGPKTAYYFKVYLLSEFLSYRDVTYLFLGARKLTGENLKVVWAEFSTLS